MTATKAANNSPSLSAARPFGFFAIFNSEISARFKFTTFFAASARCLARVSSFTSAKNDTSLYCGSSDRVAESQASHLEIFLLRVLAPRWVGFRAKECLVCYSTQYWNGVFKHAFARWQADSGIVCRDDLFECDRLIWMEE